jgi:hypothetical protein
MTFEPLPPNTVTTPEAKTFTTHCKKPKTTINISRKGSIVKERCRQLSEIALNLFPDRVITDLDLKDLVMMYIGGDKETVRSYTGYYGHIRQGRYGDNKVVGLARKGYFELLGFGHKIGHGRWLIHSQSVLFEAVNSPPAYKELVSGGFGSKEKISLSATSPCVACEKPGNTEAKERKEEEASEKERNFSPMIYGEQSQSEAAILQATPCNESDRAKVFWGCKEGSS